MRLPKGDARKHRILLDIKSQRHPDVQLLTPYGGRHEAEGHLV